MTIRERILSKPPEVQIVLKAKMTKLRIDEGSPDCPHETYAEEALAWWDTVCRDLGVNMQDEDDEAALAIQITQGLRRQKVWGKILREGTQ